MGGVPSTYLKGIGLGGGGEMHVCYFNTCRWGYPIGKALPFKSLKMSYGQQVFLFLLLQREKTVL